MPLINLKSNLSQKDPSKDVNLFTRIADDVKRVARVMDPTKAIGAKFLFTQAGLQLMNPKMTSDNITDPIIFPTRIFNPLGILAATAVSPLGSHPKRHGLLIYGGYNYTEHSTLNNLPLVYQTNNRLIALRRNMLQRELPILRELILYKIINYKGEPIKRLSGVAGPNSIFGIGYTGIHRHTQTFDLFDPINYATSTGTTKNNLDGSKSQIKIPNDFIKQTNLETDKEKISNSPSNKNTDNIRSVPSTSNKQYLTLKYKEFAAKQKDLYNDSEADFIQVILNGGNKAPFLPDLKKSGTEYKDFTREYKFGMQQYVPGSDRSDFTKVQDKGDMINLIEIGNEYPGNIRDFIKFYFTDINGKYKLIFRAILSSLGDSINGSWASTQILGKADPVWYYESYSRDVSFNFKVFTNSREEQIINYKKVNELFSFLAPKYVSNNRMIGPLMTLTIGDYLIETPGFITSISVNIPDDSTWEINLEGKDDVYQLPHLLDINISYTIIGKNKPELHKNILDVVSKFTPTAV